MAVVDTQMCLSINIISKLPVMLIGVIDISHSKDVAA